MEQGKRVVDEKHSRKSKLSQVAKQFSIGTQLGLCKGISRSYDALYMTS